MSAPTVSAYSTTAITITWNSLTSPDNGNSPILGYELQWDNALGTEVYTTLVDALTTTYTVPSNMLTTGATYKFRVRARNVYGSASTFSSATSTLAVSRPGIAPTPVVELGTGADELKVRITWADTTPTNGLAIQEY